MKDSSTCRLGRFGADNGTISPPGLRMDRSTLLGAWRAAFSRDSWATGGCPALPPYGRAGRGHGRSRAVATLLREESAEPPPVTIVRSMGHSARACVLSLSLPPRSPALPARPPPDDDAATAACRCLPLLITLALAGLF